MNYAELQRRFDQGDVTLSECRRLGSTHQSYGWACTPPGQFSEEQVQAYREGFHDNVAFRYKERR